MHIDMTRGEIVAGWVQGKDAGATTATATVAFRLTMNIVFSLEVGLAVQQFLASAVWWERVPIRMCSPSCLACRWN